VLYLSIYAPSYRTQEAKGVSLCAQLQRRQLLSPLDRQVQVVTKRCTRARLDAARVQLQPEMVQPERRHPLGQLLDLDHDRALCLAGSRCLLVRLSPRPLRRLEIHQRLVQVLLLVLYTRALHLHLLLPAACHEPAM
jgi:hypothetical protein